MDNYSEKDDKKISGGMKAYNSSETTSNQQISKYNTGANGNTGHGFAAEDVNASFDQLKGKKVEKVGTNNKKNGADRIVNGNRFNQNIVRLLKEQ